MENKIDNKFVYIKVRREVAEEMKNHFMDLIILGLSSTTESNKFNKNIIKAIERSLK